MGDVMIDPIQTLEERVSELLDVVRQTVRERDAMRARLDSLESERGPSAEAGALAELEKRRLQALEVVESALSELGQSESAA